MLKSELISGKGLRPVLRIQIVGWYMTEKQADDHFVKSITNRYREQEMSENTQKKRKIIHKFVHYLQKVCYNDLGSDET